ncbi:hypothetical protein E4U42_000277 [Claviceps africana]|uniref:NADH dehydrogenase [ubiquinone] 1 alpha subcomplex subunit 13 n=1 Tax=Claviceps africana TaxID=83212 RepID=A0A8K0J5M0_9HYPO|nr:hypothetical protein E4U42_000277 [Claviceps africana]
MAQDMPPKGGYEPVQYKRNLPAKGFRPGIVLLGVGAIMGYGWYKLIGGMREANELAREKMWARIHLVPLLQAEEDRDQVRRYWADQQRERELLGENTKVYNNQSRFVRPTFAVSPAPSKTEILLNYHLIVHAVSGSEANVAVSRRPFLPVPDGNHVQAESLRRVV